LIPKALPAGRPMPFTFFDRTAINKYAHKSALR
jgi:hypothetical protein